MKKNCRIEKSTPKSRMVPEQSIIPKNNKLTELKNTLLYAGLEPEEYAAVVPEARRQNHKMLPMYTSACIVIFTGLFILSGVLGVNYVENRWVYLAMMLINLGLYLCATRITENYQSTTGVLALCFIAALYGFSFYISLNHSDVPAITPVALLLVIPYMFDFRPICEVLMTLCAAFLYCVLSMRVKVHVLAMDDLWHMSGFAAAASIASLVQPRMKFQLIHQSRINRYLSETDMLTKTRNRNAYEHRLAAYGKKCRYSAACVYADVNGLHEMNNTLGHEAGDRMLQEIAAAIKKQFGKEDTYRVGGDEFVAIQMDISLEDLRCKVDAMKAEITALGYDTSLGIAVHEREGIDMAKLVRMAEMEMYVEKRNYYSQKTHDRRGNRFTSKQ